METEIKPYDERDIAEMIRIWNDVVEEGAAFPQTEILTNESGKVFFSEQSFTGAAYDILSGELAGLYILHPNNVGRCAHICNASFAVRPELRGRHVGEALVRHCIGKGRELGFRILQFNAVVKTNGAAMKLYEKLGFVKLGVIPGGFLNKKGEYEDIVPHYLVL